MSGYWQPIETAPKDGTAILISSTARSVGEDHPWRWPHESPLVARWAIGPMPDMGEDDFTWVVFESRNGPVSCPNPKYWTHLPEPPEEA